MYYRQHTKNDVQDIVQLFAAVFGDSEGEAEGALISQLARDLFEKTDLNDLFNYVAEADGQIIGSIFFTRLKFESGIEAFILAPVAVRTEYQGKGIGQALFSSHITRGYKGSFRAFAARGLAWPVTRW